MWGGWRWALAALGVSGTLLACGCLQSGMPGSGLSAMSAHPPGGVGPVGQGGPTPNGAPGSPPGPVNLAGYNQLAEYQAADLSQKLAELQDENKSLMARLQGVQQLLEERERAVVAGHVEVQAVTQEVARARQEINRCRQEIAGLREQARAADRENQASLQSMLNMVETLLDRANPPAGAPAKDKDVTKPPADKH